MIFILLRMGLASCYDFAFMAKASFMTLIVIYVPTILIVRLRLNTAISYYVAMYIPHFVMIFVFGWRMLLNMSSLRAGKEGPWTSHLDGKARSYSIVRDDEHNSLSGHSSLQAPLL